MVMGPSRAMEVAVAMAGANCSPASTSTNTNKVLCCYAAALVFMGFKKESLWFRMAFIVYTNTTNPI